MSTAATRVPSPGDLAARMQRYFAHTGDRRYRKAAKALLADLPAPKRPRKPSRDDSRAIEIFRERQDATPGRDPYELVRSIVAELFPDAACRARYRHAARIRRKLNIIAPHHRKEL